MAARLMKQCTCLLREATRLVPTVAPVARLRLAGVACKTLNSSASSPSSGSLTELLGKEQVFTPYPEHQEVDYLIEKATRPEELLELLSSDHNLHHNHAALILVRLSYLLSGKPKEKALLVEDARFQQLVKLVDSQVSSFTMYMGGNSHCWCL